MVPTKIERSSWIDSEQPVRVYAIDKDKEHKAVRLTYRLGGRNEYWGVQMTDWEDAPVSPAGTSSGSSAAGATSSTTTARGSTWSCSHGRRLVLGGQHAARPALERDDDRDREEPPAARDRLQPGVAG